MAAELAEARWLSGVEAKPIIKTVVVFTVKFILVMPYPGCVPSKEKKSNQIICKEEIY